MSISISLSKSRSAVSFYCIGEVEEIRVRNKTIDHFTVVCSVTWPLYGSEARVDLVLIQTSLLLSCKCT